MGKRRILVIGLVLALVLSLAGPAAIAAAQPPQMVPVLIAFDRQPGPAEEAMVRGAGGAVKYTYHLVPAIAASVPEAAIAGLLRNPNVIRVEPDIEVFAVGQTVPWGVSRIGAPDVHAAGNQGSGIKVAILDTGIAAHSDLAIAGGIRFYTTGIVLRSDNNYSDANGHGTHVAGTVAALNNSIGVLGVAPAVSLYAVKVLGDGSGRYSDIIAGIQWSVDNGMNVTNNSYGSAGDPGVTVKNAFDNAYNAGVLHVAAAGNEKGGAVIYPAKYASVIAVSATTNSDTLASFSSVGSEVELAAPGEYIYSTYPGNSYGTMSGTSMASPHVTGAAALVWAANPGWSNADVRTQLRATAEWLSGLNAMQQDYGLVDAAAALGIVPAPPEAGTVTGTVTASGGAAIEGAAVSTDTGESAFTDSSGSYALADVPAGSRTVTASADGYHSQTETVTVTDGATTTQNFVLSAIPTYTLTMQAPEGQGTVTPAIGEHTYLEGTMVNLTATPASGWQFDYWIGNVADTTSAATTVTMDADKTVQAVFAEVPAPEPGTVRVDSITYATSGGRLQDKHLQITIALVDGSGNLVAGATVSIALTNETLGRSWNYNGTTGTGGTVTFSLNNAPSGTYTTTVTGVTATGSEWDGETPENTFSK